MGIFSGSTAARALAYGYSNARTKSMKTALLTGKDFDSLIAAHSVEEMAAFLEHTSFKEDLVAVALQQHADAANLEAALSRNFSKAVEKLQAFSPASALPVVQAGIKKYEINNIKACLLGLHTGKQAEDILPLVSRISLPAGFYARLYSQGAVEKAVQFLKGTEYFQPLASALPAYVSSKNLQPLLQALDFHFYASMEGIAKHAGRDERIIAELLKAEIDVKNALMVLRLMEAQQPASSMEHFLLSGGALSKEKLAALASSSSLEKAASFFGKHFAVDVQEALARHEKTRTLIPLENTLQLALVRKGISALRRSTLSLGALFGFLLLKENELNSVRKIARAKEFHLSEALQKELVVA